MQEFLDMILVDGNLLETFVRVLILFFSFDFLITFAGVIKSIKSSVS